MAALYVAIMILGLAGMILCSKKQKTNPAMQPVAFVLFIVVVIGAGLLLKHMNIFGGQDSLIKNELTFYSSQGTVTGEYLKSVNPGQKILMAVEPGFENSESIKLLMNSLKSGYGGEVVMDTVSVPGANDDSMPLYMSMRAADFDRLVEAHPDASIIVSTIGLPQDAGNVKFMKLPADRRPMLFLMGLPSGPVPGLQQALNSGIITGMVISNPQAKYDVSAPSNPREAFKIRYVMVTKDNAEEYKAHYSN